MLLALSGIYTQEIPTTTDGEVIGIDDIVSYSVGRVVYTTNTGTNVIVVHGVQQPYEISTLLCINETKINLKLSVYPNTITKIKTKNN